MEAPQITYSEPPIHHCGVPAVLSSGIRVEAMGPGAEEEGAEEALIAIFEQIAREENWQPGRELRAHVRRSTYFALVAESEQGEKIVGGLQLVHPDTCGNIPCQKVWPELDFAGRTDHAHIAMLALKKEWRGKATTSGALFWSVAIAMWRHCVQRGIKELWLEATPRTLRCYQRLGWPLQIRGPLRVHWGEPCYICSLNVREVAGALAEKALASPTHRHLLARACSDGPAAMTNRGDASSTP